MHVDWVAGGSSLLEFPPALGYKRLFLANAHGDLIAYSTATGKRAWVLHERRCTASSPAVNRYEGGTVYEAFLQKEPCKSRKASGEILTRLAPVLPELWGGSADLAESNNTTMEGEPSFVPAEHQTKMWSGGPYGRTLHGGALFSLADSAFAFATNGGGTLSVAIDMHLGIPVASYPGDVLVAEAVEQSQSNRLAFVDVTVRNQRAAQWRPALHGVEHPLKQCSHTWLVAHVDENAQGVAQSEAGLEHDGQLGRQGLHIRQAAAVPGLQHLAPPAVR